MLQVTNVTYPDGGSVTNWYNKRGELEKTAGARTYPVQYTYDYAGRMESMTTWTNFASNLGAAVTTWHYHPQRGWLVRKSYQGENDATDDYQYDKAGRLTSRDWERGVTTTYSYNAAGDLETVIYSDSTPSVTNSYDRRGRLSAISAGTNFASTLTYNNADQLVKETWTAGPLNGFSVTNGYDTALRRSFVTASGSGVSHVVGYTYDAGGRLATVSQGAQTAAYTYLANSSLAGQIAFKQSGTTRMTTTRSYDNLNRLTQVSSVPTAAAAVNFGYAYNDANQRTRSTLVDGSYWEYEYDSLGQVKTGNKRWQDGTRVAGEQFEYVHDDIGNRRTAKTGGEVDGSNLRQGDYAVNLKNQYTSRTVPNYVEVQGISFATNTVTVNGQSTYRKGEYFRKELQVTNSSAAVWMGVTVAATGQSNVPGSVFVPKTAEVFTHDDDGNLTGDGRWTYEWDAENRLKVMRTLSGSPAPERRIEFVYDSKGRRIRQTVWNNRTSGGTNLSDTCYLYDGWNLVAELTSGGSLVRSYVWGTDLSGSQQGAGGVGGLLQVNFHGSSTTNCFVAYDGNGNVMALVNAGNGETVGQYEYGPFGEPLRVTGNLAKANPIRFSTKYQDSETDLLYYGYRYYNANTGRWPNRDPIEEFGGRALYAFVGNNPISFIDAFGLADTLEPGGNANGSIPANGPGIRPQDRPPINELGNKHGCHTCGSKTPGTKSGNWIPDHQPSSALAKPGQPQRLYPHCLPCSQKQGGEVAAALRAQRANAARGGGRGRGGRGGAALLVLGGLNMLLDKAIAAQDERKFNDAYEACEKKAAEAGLDEGCGCCIIGVTWRWSRPARGPTWLDRLGGRTMGYGPSGTATLGNVSGTFYDQPCDEVHDPGVWLDWSSTYDSHKISF